MPTSLLPSVRAGTVFVSILLSVSVLRAQEVPNLPAATVTADQPAGVRDVYLEVFINNVSMKMIGNFKQRPNGSLAATAEELREVGIKPPADADDGKLIELGTLPGLSYQVDDQTQRLYVQAADKGRAPHVINVRQQQDSKIPAPQSGYGAVLNYSLYASSNDLSRGDYDIFQGISGSFDARLFSPYGTLSSLSWPVIPTAVSTVSPA